MKQRRKLGDLRIWWGGGGGVVVLPEGRTPIPPHVWCGCGGREAETQGKAAALRRHAGAPKRAGRPALGGGPVLAVTAHGSARWPRTGRRVAASLVFAARPRRRAYRQQLRGRGAHRLSRDGGPGGTRCTRPAVALGMAGHGRQQSRRGGGLPGRRRAADHAGAQPTRVAAAPPAAQHSPRRGGAPCGSPALQETLARGRATSSVAERRVGTSPRP
jgi:hypothetical protein